jgi:beta-phosphoglucomutase-like phosphatase (HAD superfamily)
MIPTAAPLAGRRALGLPDGIRGCLFDLDGVLTRTAEVHAAGREMFDGFLREWSRPAGEQFVPFGPSGAARITWTASRGRTGRGPSWRAGGIHLPEGRQDDPPDSQTVHGLSNRNNLILLRRIREDGCGHTRDRSARCALSGPRACAAVVSSRANCRDVLAATRIEDLFEARIDGIVAEREHLRGKPDPDSFLAGARALGLEPPAAAVFEDCAGRRGSGAGRRIRLRGRR